MLGRFKSLPSPLIRVSRDLEHQTLSRRERGGEREREKGDGGGRERALQMEISLRNVNIPYKRVASTHFSELLLCLLFLKNNQRKIILMPKGIFWADEVCPPSRGMSLVMGRWSLPLICEATPPHLTYTSQEVIYLRLIHPRRQHQQPRATLQPKARRNDWCQPSVHCFLLLF